MLRSNCVLLSAVSGVLFASAMIACHVALGQTPACTGICHDSYVYGVTTYNTGPGIGCGSPAPSPLGPYCSDPTADNASNSSTCNFKEVLYSNSGCDLYNQEPTALTCSQVVKRYVVLDNWIVRCNVSSNACSCSGMPVGQTDTDAPHCTVISCP